MEDILKNLNFIWTRDPHEAFENPYEYEAQDQFLREANSVLDCLFSHLMKTNRSFVKNDTSLEKAIWMLHVDSCETLRDCRELLSQKNARMAIKFFRDIIEVLDTVSYFLTNDNKSKKALSDWFNNESPRHFIYRNYVGSTVSEDLKKELEQEYKYFSKFTHRTYESLGYNYILGSNDIMSYEGIYSISVLPNPISHCIAILGNFIIFFVRSLNKSSLISKEEIQDIFNKSIENERVKRRFKASDEKYKEYLEAQKKLR
ncbi:hypothetical protein DR864_25365 [Runella rosea]|uniref:Uncharacterized protein n=1 Tax=Runella rosea TaxID=2259595 RepID=A0A344TQA3_9BACT|nr:hypothetical protein [Runella rosea]AXE20824.1 hypothetical protein DR864_25365 [Runella rosea]